MAMTIKEGVASWAERWRGLNAFAGRLEGWRVQIRMRRVGDYSTGHFWSRDRRIVVTACTDLVDSLGTILHEYAHAARTRRADVDYAVHDEEWQRTYAAAVFEVTGRRIPEAVPEYTLMDRAARDVMATWWRDSGNEFAWKLLAKKG